MDLYCTPCGALRGIVVPFIFVGCVIKSNDVNDVLLFLEEFLLLILGGAGPPPILGSLEDCLLLSLSTIEL